MRFQFLDKIGAFGAFLAAVSCPACFPLLAVAGSALGLGFLRPYEGMVTIVLQVLVFVALVGNVLSFRRHKRVLLLMVGLASPILIFFSLYVYFTPTLLYLGLFGLMVAAIMNSIAGRQCSSCKT